MIGYIMVKACCYCENYVTHFYFKTPLNLSKTNAKLKKWKMFQIKYGKCFQLFSDEVSNKKSVALVNDGSNLAAKYVQTFVVAFINFCCQRFLVLVIILIFLFQKEQSCGEKKQLRGPHIGFAVGGWVEILDCDQRLKKKVFAVNG